MEESLELRQRLELFSFFVAFSSLFGDCTFIEKDSLVQRLYIAFIVVLSSSSETLIV